MARINEPRERMETIAWMLDVPFEKPFKANIWGVPGEYVLTASGLMNNKYSFSEGYNSRASQGKLESLLIGEAYIIRK